MKLRGILREGDEVGEYIIEDPSGDFLVARIYVRYTGTMRDTVGHVVELTVERVVV